jgi:uncharacterized protein DUF5320
MPRRDGTGPVGMRRMIGRGAGFCDGSGMPGYANAGAGRRPGLGIGRGRGFFECSFGGGGRGRRSMRCAAPSGNATQYRIPDPEMETQALKGQAVALQAELDSVKNRISKIETKTTRE